MIVARFNRRFHTVRDLAAMCHRDDLPELHVRVKGSMKGCPACPELTSQPSPPNDFAAGIG